MISCIEILNGVTQRANERQHEVWLHYFDVKDEIENSTLISISDSKVLLYREHIIKNLKAFKTDLSNAGNDVSKYGDMNLGLNYRIAFIQRIEKELTMINYKTTITGLESSANVANHLMNILKSKELLDKSEENFYVHGIIW